MLTKNRKGVIALAAALTLTAGALQVSAQMVGNQNIVTIVDGGYIPSISYIEPGETLIFENWSDAEHTVGDSGGVWTSGPISTEGGTFTLTVQENTPLLFGGIDVFGVGIEGEISFDEPELAN